MSLPWEDFQDIDWEQPKEQSTMGIAPNDEASKADRAALWDLLAEPKRVAAEGIEGVIHPFIKTGYGVGRMLPDFYGSLAKGDDFDTALQKGSSSNEEMRALEEKYSDALGTREHPSMFMRGFEQLITPAMEWAEGQTGDSGFATAGLEAIGDISFMYPTLRGVGKAAPHVADYAQQKLSSQAGSVELPFYSQAAKAVESGPPEFKGTPDVQLQGRPEKVITNPKTGEIIKTVPGQEGKVVPGKSATTLIEEYLQANQVKPDEIKDLGLMEWARDKEATHSRNQKLVSEYELLYDSNLQHISNNEKTIARYKAEGDFDGLAWGNIEGRIEKLEKTTEQRRKELIDLESRISKAKKPFSLTKDEIADHIANEGWELKDFQYGGKVEVTPIPKEALPEVYHGEWDRYDDFHKRGDDYFGRDLEHNDYVNLRTGEVLLMEDVLVGDYMSPTDPRPLPKYSQYVEKGDKSNNVELFVTANKPDKNRFFQNDKGDWQYLKPDGRPVNGRWGTRREAEQAFREMHPQEANNILVEFGLDENVSDKMQTGPTWRDGHGSYDEVKNPIVRIRMNDRTIDGKNYLFIEEMQGPTPANQQSMPESLRKRIYDIGTKRALAYAKENGYAGIAWTTGEMQVKRWESALRKQVDDLRFDESTGELTGYKNTQRVFNESGVTRDNLDTFVGKDIAKKLLDEENRGKSSWETHQHVDWELQPDGSYYPAKELWRRITEEGDIATIDGNTPPLAIRKGQDGLFYIDHLGDTGGIIYHGPEGLFPSGFHTVQGAIKELTSYYELPYRKSGTVVQRNTIHDVQVAEGLSPGEFVLTDSDGMRITSTVFPSVERAIEQANRIFHGETRITGENITIDKKWPGELYGNFREGEVKRVERKTDHPDDPDVPVFREDSWELQNYDGVEAYYLDYNVLGEDSPNVSIIKEEGGWRISDDNGVVPDDHLYPTALDAQNAVRDAFVSPSEQLGEVTYNTVDFDQSAMIPSKMKKYGKEDVGSVTDTKPPKTLNTEAIMNDMDFRVALVVENMAEQTGVPVVDVFKDILNGNFDFFEVPGLASPITTRQQTQQIIQRAMDDIPDKQISYHELSELIDLSMTARTEIHFRSELDRVFGEEQWTGPQAYQLAKNILAGDTPINPELTRVRAKNGLKDFVESYEKNYLGGDLIVPGTKITANTPSSFPLYDVTGAMTKFIKDEIKQNGKAKTALKYGVPPAALTAYLRLKDDDPEKGGMLTGSLASVMMGPVFFGKGKILSPDEAKKMRLFRIEEKGDGNFSVKRDKFEDKNPTEGIEAHKLKDGTFFGTTPEKAAMASSFPENEIGLSDRRLKNLEKIEGGYHDPNQPRSSSFKDDFEFSAGRPVENSVVMEISEKDLKYAVDKKVEEKEGASIKELEEELPHFEMDYVRQEALHDLLDESSVTHIHIKGIDGTKGLDEVLAAKSGTTKIRGRESLYSAPLLMEALSQKYDEEQ